jgi:enoyl-CoA hydratase/carnithine racemase
MYENILISTAADSVRIVTLNRPRQLNALNRKTFQELNQAIEEFEASQDSILILTGSGRAFCFGADFQEFQDRDQLPELLEIFQSLILRVYECSKITIAALNGFATGAGLDLALACDFRLASDRSKLGEAYISMGLVSDGGGSFFLTHALGISRAMHLLATGDSIDPAYAYQLGLVTGVYPADQLQNEALLLAQKLAAKPQTALRLIKRLVKQNFHTDLKTALQNEHAAQLQCFDDPTHQSIVTDFLNRKSKKSGED